MTFINYFAYFIAVGGKGGGNISTSVCSPLSRPTISSTDGRLGLWRTGQARAAPPQVTSVPPGSRPKCVTIELPWCCWCCWCPVAAPTPILRVLRTAIQPVPYGYLIQFISEYACKYAKYVKTYTEYAEKYAEYIMKYALYHSMQIDIQNM